MALPCWRGAPLRIAVASDLHIGSPGVGLPKLDALVAHINAARPDIVLLLGDFVIQGVAGGRFVPARNDRRSPACCSSAARRLRGTWQP